MLRVEKECQANTPKNVGYSPSTRWISRLSANRSFEWEHIYSLSMAASEWNICRAEPFPLSPSLTVRDASRA